MHIWGLTGGIASGKSTVAKAFADLGVPSIDADALYHSLIAPAAGGQPSPLAQAVASEFPGVLGADGRLDRPGLAARIFADTAARARLNAITHPAVQAAAATAMAALEQRGIAHALYDVPLLFENDLAHRFAGVVVVWVPREVQLARLCARDGLSMAAAEARLAAQWPLTAKRKLATWVIDNSLTLEQTHAQVAAVAQAMAAPAGPLAGPKRP